ncbi:dermonecrotic toxin domain-containing protein [Pseudomonas mediterranea]
MLENTPSRTDSPPTPSTPLINLLETSQQQMIRLNGAFPRASGVLEEYLDDWFSRTFPALPGNVTAKEIFVCRRKEKGRTTTRLGTLFWRAIAGKLNVREFFDEPDNIDLVIHQNDATDMPTALNSSDAKQELKQLLSITPGSCKQLLTQALDDFWAGATDFRQGRSVSTWLAAELALQLKAQADLHKLDGTLRPSMHKALVERVLLAPDAASRGQLPQYQRPGVHSLSVIPQGWSVSVPVPMAVVLTQHDSPSESGGAVLYRPGEPLRIHEDLAALKASLQEDGDPGDEIETTPIAEHFLARLVTELRTVQRNAVGSVFLNGPAEAEEIDAWMGRLDTMVELGNRLDLAAAMDERELRLSLKKLDNWLHANPHVTGSDRLAWWQATHAVQTTLVEAVPAPDPVTLATPDALHARTRTLLAGVIREKYPPVDPEDVSLTIRKQVIDPHAPTGGSPFGSGISQGSVRGVIDDRRSLTEWAMSNLTLDERNAPRPTVEGPLSFAQIVEILERANVGARLPTELQIVARQTQAHWMVLKAQQMRAQVWAAHISGDLRHDRDNTGLKLVLAALDSPTAAGRGKVGGHEVVVHQLHWGNSVLKEILAFGVKALASRPSLTLYTPGAPDGKTFRDVDATSSRTLETTLVQTLTATPEMTRWLISQLPLLEQAEQFASLVPLSEDLTFEQKIKKVAQSVFAWVKDRAQHDFARKIASPAVEANLLQVLHETQITHAIKTTEMLTVSNAERDSAAAQEGRRNGVMLLTGAMSMFPVGRLGGLLGRAILPTVAGGAAVSAVDDENGSLRQWTSDFISGLGEVMAEAGQDLIMARAGRRRHQVRPTLSSIPRMPDPELEPYRLKGFDGHGLTAEGRHRYRDASGQGYLKLGKGYYKTAVQAGEQIIYSPNNRTDQRTVTWGNDGWRVEERYRLRGGGALQSLFDRSSETPQQRTCNALVEGVLVMNRYPSLEAVSTARDIFQSMPEALAERLLRESMADIGALDINRYHAQILDWTQGRGNLSRRKAFQQELLDKMNTWSIVVLSSKDIEANVFNVTLNDIQKIKIYDTILSHRSMFFTEERIRVNTTIITDNITGAIFMAFTSKGSRKKVAMDKIAQGTREMLNAVEAKLAAKAQALFPGNEPGAKAAREKYLASDECYDELTAALREEKQRRHKPGLLTEIRNNRVPYIIANKGRTQRNVMLLTGEDITNFSRTLANYEPFDIEIVTQARTHKVEGTPSTVTPPALPSPSPASDKFTVTTSSLAETQMSYASFSEAAKTRVRVITEDIRAGRITTKKINRYYWYTMAQLTPGGGKGAWRAAFEREGDNWLLRGFYDYHANGPATVWEG